MSAPEHLHPSQFGDVYSRLLGKTLPEIAKHHYANSPQYMRSLQRDISRRGIQYPVVMNREDPHDIVEGHHRAAVAYRLGIPIPTVPEPEEGWAGEGYKEDTQRWHERYLRYTWKNAGMPG